MQKVLLHVDMNNYYASVESLFNPSLRTVPMAVCGDPAMRHGIILAKNELAKKHGIITAESIYSAKQKCPRLTTIMADYPKYIRFAKMSREIYRQYSHEVIPFGLDEAWIDLTGRVNGVATGERMAEDIRTRIKAELGLTVSIGVSYNYIFSKLASDMKKPDAVTVLPQSDLKSVIWKLPAFELLFVGKVTRQKLAAAGILTIGDIAGADVKFLRRLLGKQGECLWLFANGDDRGFDPKIPQDDPFKSIGNSITMPYDLQSELDILTMFYVLSKTVSSRLEKHALKAACISILIKYSDFNVINRQVTVNTPTNNKQDIYTNAKRLFMSNFARKPVRSVGIHVSKLYNNKYEQLTLLERELGELDEIKEIERNLQGKLKNLKVERYFGFNGG
ncbi:MAG: DNA polymerase IV [Oscillospiraceae bacterium]|nr:DNA polymerase IV [Oscillospiraceae bacterium]